MKNIEEEIKELVYEQGYSSMVECECVSSDPDESHLFVVMCKGDNRNYATWLVNMGSNKGLYNKKEHTDFTHQLSDLELYEKAMLDFQRRLK